MCGLCNSRNGGGGSGGGIAGLFIALALVILVLSLSGCSAAVHAETGPSLAVGNNNGHFEVRDMGGGVTRYYDGELGIACYNLRHIGSLGCAAVHESSVR